MLYIMLWLCFFSGSVYASEQQAAVWTQSDVARVFAGGDLHVPTVSSCYSIPRLKDGSGENTPVASPNVTGCPAFPAVRSMSSSSGSLYNQPVSVEERELKSRPESIMTQVGSPTDSYLPTVTVGSPKETPVGVDFVRVFAGRGRRVLQSPIVPVVQGFPVSNVVLLATESSAYNRHAQNDRRANHKKNETQFLHAVRNAFNDMVEVESRSNSSDPVQSPNNHFESAFPTTLDQQIDTHNVENSSEKSPRHSDASSVPGVVPEEVTDNVAQSAGSVNQGLNPVPQSSDKEYGSGCWAGLMRCLRGQSDTQSK
ncbi:hypothetical protein KBD08_02690 [Candidatus Babeliales bacterium]|nr:hypothetical protein [Candidatus Babeliales bacterium]